MIRPSSFILLPCVDPAAVYATFPLLATEPVRLPGDLAPLQGAVDRRQSQPGQGLQLRLRLLLRRSDQSADGDRGRSGCAPGRAGSHGEVGLLGGIVQLAAVGSDSR